MDYEEDDFFDEEFDEIKDDELAANPLSTHSRLSAGGEYPATFNDYDNDDEDEEENEREVHKGQVDSRSRQSSLYSGNFPSLSASAPLPSPDAPLAGSLEEKARLAVSALIRGAVGESYDEQVLVEEENESVDEDNSFGLQVPPAFVSELYHGAEDSTESTGQSSSQEDVGNGESIPSEAPKVRVAAWRLSGAQEAGALHGGHSPGKNRRGTVAGKSDKVNPYTRTSQERRNSATNGRDGNDDGDDEGLAAGAESATRSSVVVGKVRVTAAMARLKGLDLNALAQRFDRPPEKGTCKAKNGGRSSNTNGAKDAQGGAKGGGDARNGRSGNKIESSNRQHLSQDFAKLSDAKNCTFKPRGKSPARRAAARAAGFTVKDDKNNNDEVDAAFGGFRPSGSGPTRAEIELEQSKAFVRRQDAFVAQKRKELARAAAEQDYDAVQGKKQCPVCGMEQTFEEVEMKQKACKGETCDGALYVKPRVVDMPTFLARQAAHSARTASIKQQSADQLRAQEVEAAELAAKRRQGRSRVGAKALRDFELVATDNTGAAVGDADGGGHDGSEAAWHEDEVYRRQKGRSSADVPGPPRNLRTPRYLSRDRHPDNETRSNFNGGNSNTKTAANHHGRDRKNNAGVGARGGAVGRNPANSRGAYAGGAWGHLDSQMAEHAEALLMGRSGFGGSIEELHPNSHGPRPAHPRGHNGGPLEFEPGARRIAAEMANLDAQRQRARQQARKAAADAAREQRAAADAAAEAALRASAKARSFTKKHVAARPQSGEKPAASTTAARITAGSESKGRNSARTTKRESSDWSRLLL